MVLFIDQAAKILIEFKQYHSQIIQYLLTVFQTFDKLKTIALQAILELSLYNKT